MPDINGEGGRIPAVNPSLPPPITEESAAGMQIATIILDHIDSTGSSVRGAHVIPDLQASGFLGKGEFFTDVKQQALGALSTRAAYEDTLSGEGHRELVAKLERAQNLRAAIIIIDHLDIVSHEGHGIHMRHQLGAEGLLGPTDHFSDLRARVFTTVSSIAALETVVVTSDVEGSAREKETAIAEARGEAEQVASI